MKTKILRMILLSVIVLLCSCASNKAGNDSIMYLMIYDYESNGVQGAGFYVGDKFLGESDVHGRFAFALKDETEYSAEIRKTGYRTEKITFSYQPSGVIYVKLGNAAQFTSLAENSLDLKKYNEALIYANYALELDSERDDTLYLKAIILNKIGNFSESNDCLSKIKRQNENKTYIEELKKRNDKGENL
ncbi:MAG: hypothetical protein J6I53_11495 [Treponema sp.]|nr:hypothetical protein [Treponema sp.]